MDFDELMDEVEDLSVSERLKLVAKTLKTIFKEDDSSDFDGIDLDASNNGCASSDEDSSYSY